MSGFRDPDLQERQNSAVTAKKAMLEKYRAAAVDPEMEKKRQARLQIHQARLDRTAARAAVEKARQAEHAAEVAREAERASQVQREAEEATARLAAEEAERQGELEAEQKAKRDARYAARKAAKKKRRRGY